MQLCKGIVCGEPPKKQKRLQNGAGEIPVPEIPPPPSESVSGEWRMGKMIHHKGHKEYKEGGGSWGFKGTGFKGTGNFWAISEFL